MKNLFLILMAFTLTFSFVSDVSADQYVNGYFKSNGTYVNGYYRSTADGNPYNNWSYPGNTNPYTGVTAGGSASSYLNNYYGNSGSSYTPSYSYPSYTPSYSYPTYTPTYSGYSSEDIYKEVSHGWKSYGILNCDSGYYEKSNKCVKDPSNGYTIGSTIFCDSGYEKEGSKCIKPNHGSYSYSGTILCDSGYRNLDDKCVKDTIKLRCELAFGTNAVPYKNSDEDCICRSGYQWNATGDSCIKTPTVQTKTIKSYVKNVGDSSVLNCNEIGWVNQSDVDSCVFYKTNKRSYNWSVI